MNQEKIIFGDLPAFPDLPMIKHITNGQVGWRRAIIILNTFPDNTTANLLSAALTWGMPPKLAKSALGYDPLHKLMPIEVNIIDFADNMEQFHRMKEEVELGNLHCKDQMEFLAARLKELSEEIEALAKSD